MQYEMAIVDCFFARKQRIAHEEEMGLEPMVRERRCEPRDTFGQATDARIAIGALERDDDDRGRARINSECEILSDRGHVGGGGSGFAGGAISGRFAANTVLNASAPAPITIFKS